MAAIANGCVKEVRFILGFDFAIVRLDVTASLAP
jgi:hypothetical protein